MALQEGTTELEDPEVEVEMLSSIGQKVHLLKCKNFCLLCRVIKIKFKIKMIAMFIDREE